MQKLCRLFFVGGGFRGRSLDVSAIRVTPFSSVPAAGFAAGIEAQSGLSWRLRFGEGRKTAPPPYDIGLSSGADVMVRSDLGQQDTFTNPGEQRLDDWMSRHVRV